MMASIKRNLLTLYFTSCYSFEVNISHGVTFCAYVCHTHNPIHSSFMT